MAVESPKRSTRAKNQLPARAGTTFTGGMDDEDRGPLARHVARQNDLCRPRMLRWDTLCTTAIGGCWGRFAPELRVHGAEAWVVRAELTR